MSNKDTTKHYLRVGYYTYSRIGRWMKRNLSIPDGMEWEYDERYCRLTLYVLSTGEIVSQTNIQL